MLILGIETSCDETSASVVENGRRILSNIISSQVSLHRRYGGVVPEIASRKHVELVIPVINQAIEEAGIDIAGIGAIGVTYGPGLAGALLVGLSAAKGLAFATNKPLIGIHHIEGHIAAGYLEDDKLEPPFICLVASGGHSQVVFVEDYCKYEIMGQTRDDAAGEAFDKVARVLGLGYPGGPLIDKVSTTGNSKAVDFPRVCFGNGSFDFSFSGLKTAVINYVNNSNMKGGKLPVADISASFQQAVADVLVDNTINAAKLKKVEKIVLAGGVAANTALRNQMRICAENCGFGVCFPQPVLCTDNAAMVACAAYNRYKKGIVSDFYLNAVPNLKLISACG